MLDGEYVVIADKAKVADHVAPVLKIVAVADGTEYPASVDFVAVMLGIEHAVDGGVELVDLCILCVDMVYRAAELAYGGNGVDTLPDKVRGIEVRADHIADRITQFKQRFDIVYAEPGVHFEGDLFKPVLLAELDFFLPVRDEDLLPLPFKDIEEILRPGAGDPVRVFGFGAIAGASGKSD